MATPLSEALSLPLDQRLALIEALWNSIVDQHADDVILSDAERAELDRRLAAHGASPEAALSWEDVRADLLRRSAAR